MNQKSCCWMTRLQAFSLAMVLFADMAAFSILSSDPSSELLAVPPSTAEPEYDVVIYGGTSAGVSAAIQARRMGKSVILIEPGKHLGGLTVSGLGQTDSGKKVAIGGVSREFYQRVRRYYGQSSVWKQEQQEDNSSYRNSSDGMWTFEPHVAEEVFLVWLREERIPYLLGEGLNRKSGVEKKDRRIVSIEMKSGKKFFGHRFIDATYEGDLLAAAGVSYYVGREANAVYDETLSGVQVGRAKAHQFTKPVDPYVVPGDTKSGLLPGILATAPGPDGSADALIQAYNYRICMTDAPENRVPFSKPENYDPLQHELLLRNFEAGDLRLPLSIGMMPNRKTDLNNNCAVSTDWIGMNHAYADADDETREQILQQHRDYVQGFLWTLAYHPRVPAQIREKASVWGYAKDEFTETGHFPFWCYIREARRMIGMYVHTEHDCRRTRICEDSVGLGSYTMDSHNCQRYVDEKGNVRNEGDVQVSPKGCYAISARSLLPKPEECENLAVPVCLSASHIAFGSIRMEPVFMILGQSAATMCCQSLDGDRPLHQVPYQELRRQLLADNQVLDLDSAESGLVIRHAQHLPGIVVDDTDAQKVGDWKKSSSNAGFIGDGYVHDGRFGLGKRSVLYRLTVPKSGDYVLRMSYVTDSNRATNALVTWTIQGKENHTRVNQRDGSRLEGGFFPLGNIHCQAGDVVTVRISNHDADGYVVADAVQLLPKE
ncbi:FAD-dependent oxidoreductase [Planctomicrobium sp. SH661]|uniref:FAD-dependent oxidoreductase n=1 Tax=Planctomicrobium sp. SH661 TaxID=3448124 RepID=UPI003F5C3C38